MRQSVEVAPQPQAASGQSLTLKTRLPAGFDSTGFLRAAKMNFLKLQAANDAGRLDQIREFIEVDSLAYLSLEGMIACTKLAASDCCTACWSGHYKIPIDSPTSKFSFEREQMKMF